MDIEAIKNGYGRLRGSNRPVRFIALLDKSIPAPLVIGIGETRMENYFMDGTLLGNGVESDEDIIVVLPPNQVPYRPCSTATF